MGGWWFLGVLVVTTAVLTPVLGRYLASVYGGGPALGDGLFGPLERVIYRVTGVDPVPIDAVTASASGFDPHISVANARPQAARMASARGMDLQIVVGIIRSVTIESTGVLDAQASVNVLELNIALEEATS